MCNLSGSHMMYFYFCWLSTRNFAKCSIESKCANGIVALHKMSATQATSDSGRKYLKFGDVDREKTCPLYLRIYHRVGGHHRVEDFDRRGREPTQDEIAIYTWKDASLRELTELLMSAVPAAKARTARFAFGFVYPDKMGRMVLREVGQTVGRPRKGEDKDDAKTLDELHFETGDFVDVAIFINS